jgi:hypothetical protein
VLAEPALQLGASDMRAAAAAGRGTDIHEPADTRDAQQLGDPLLRRCSMPERQQLAHQAIVPGQGRGPAALSFTMPHSS